MPGVLAVFLSKELLGRREISCRRPELVDPVARTLSWSWCPGLLACGAAFGLHLFSVEILYFIRSGRHA